MSTLTDRLDEWAALAEKATPGPWTIGVVGYQEPDEYVLHDGDGQTIAALDYSEASWCDSQFAAASRAAVPALVEALRAVLALHKPRSFWIANPDDELMWRTRDEAHDHKRADVIEPEEIKLCEACMRTAYEYDDGDTVSEGGYGPSAEWPCSTVDAIATALEVTQ